MAAHGSAFAESFEDIPLSTVDSYYTSSDTTALLLSEHVWNVDPTRDKAGTGHLELAFRSLNTPSGLGGELLSLSRFVMELAQRFALGSCVTAVLVTDCCTV